MSQQPPRTCRRLAATWPPLRSDEAACAASIFDDELLAESLAQLVSPGASDEIGSAAGREGHDDPDGLVGPWSLGPADGRSGQSWRAQSHGAGGHTEKVATSHSIPPLTSLVSGRSCTDRIR